MPTATKKFVIKDPESPATDRQVTTVNKLFTERDVPADFIERTRTKLENLELTKQQASDAIGWLLNRPNKIIETKVITGPGVYVGSSDRIYSAAYKKGYTPLVFRRVIAHPGEKPRLIRVYERAARTDIETGGHKMTLDEADAWGKAHGYNGMSFCLSCGRLLTAEESVRFGIGPICREKSIWA